MITMWYLQSHRTWDRFCHSCIGSPSSPLGPSRRGSLCRLSRRCTPDRSKLFGSHGQRPWLHDVVIQRFCREISELTGRQWAWLDEQEQISRLNRKLEGWAIYFCLGQVSKAYQAVDRHTCHRLRQWLRAKHQDRPLGYSRYPNESL